MFRVFLPWRMGTPICGRWLRMEEMRVSSYRQERRHHHPCSCPACVPAQPFYRRRLIPARQLARPRSRRRHPVSPVANPRTDWEEIRTKGKKRGEALLSYCTWGMSHLCGGGIVSSATFFPDEPVPNIEGIFSFGAILSLLVSQLNRCKNGMIPSHPGISSQPNTCYIYIHVCGKITKIYS